MTKEEFKQKIPDSNPEWVAQEILSSYTQSEINQLRFQLKKLHNVAYKSWARENMSLNDFIEAVDIIKGLK